jgi:cytosine/uracil/thiamine/allantoin permease
VTDSALELRRALDSHVRLHPGLHAGFLATVHVLPKEKVAPIFMAIYGYAWFVGFAAAFVARLLPRLLKKRSMLKYEESSSAAV